MENLLQDDLKRELQPGDRLVLWLPVFLGLGIGCYFSLDAEPARAVLWSLFGAAVLASLLTRSLRIYQSWRYAVALAVLVTLGLVLAQLRTQGMETNLLTDRYFGAEISGRIQSIERMGAGWRVLLNEAHVDGSAEKYLLRATIRQKDFKPEIGGRITAKASLMPPSPPLVPGMFDFQRNAYFQGLGGYGFVTKIGTYEPPVSATGNDDLLVRYREFLSGQSYAHLEQPEAGITTALLNGQRGGIARKTTNDLQQSGLYHIISISGVHISLMAGIVFFLSRFLMALNMRLASYWPIKKIAAALALLAIVLYMLVVGADPATARSVITAGIVLVAIMLDREAINLRLVAIAALVLMLAQPESLLNIGFQLSFAAVASLVAFYQFTHSFWQHAAWKNSIILKILLPVILAVVTSIVATLATAPLVFFHFQQVPILSLAANALAMPVVDFIVMPGTFLCYLLTPFPVFGGWALQFMGFGVMLILKISAWITSLPLAVWRVPAIPQSSVLLMMAALFLGVVLVSRWRLLALAPFAAGVMILAGCTPPDILIASNRVIAMRQDDMLQLEGRVDNFSKTLFQQFTATAKSADFPCEGDICHVTSKGRTIALIRTVSALAQACAQEAEIILTRYYLDRPCPGKRVFDRHVMEEKGGAVLWLDDLRVRTVYRTRDRRPWQAAQKQGWQYQGAKGKIDGKDTVRTSYDRKAPRQ